MRPQSASIDLLLVVIVRGDELHGLCWDIAGMEGHYRKLHYCKPEISCVDTLAIIL